MKQFNEIAYLIYDVRYVGKDYFICKKEKSLNIYLLRDNETFEELKLHPDQRWIVRYKYVNINKFKFDIYLSDGGFTRVWKEI